MSVVMNLLEKMGLETELNSDNGGVDVTAINQSIDPALLEAIKQKDHAALRHLLGARMNIVCAVYAPEEDKPGESEETPPSKEPDTEAVIQGFSQVA